MRLDRVRRADEGRVAEHGHRLEPGLPEGLDRQRSEPLGERVPVGADEQAVMPERRPFRPEGFE